MIMIIANSAGRNSPKKFLMRYTKAMALGKTLTGCVKLATKILKTCLTGKRPNKSFERTKPLSCSVLPLANRLASSFC